MMKFWIYCLKKIKKILKYIAEIRFYDSKFEKPVKIANFASDCCDKLNIEYFTKIYDLDFINMYLNPKFNLLNNIDI